MKVYAQFWSLDTGYIAGSNPPKFGDPRPAQATGDRAVIMLDGRNRSEAWHAIAADEAKRRGYVGYTLHRGERIGAPACTKLVRVDGLTDLQTVSKRIGGGA